MTAPMTHGPSILFVKHIGMKSGAMSRRPLMMGRPSVLLILAHLKTLLQPQSLLKLVLLRSLITPRALSCLSILITQPSGHTLPGFLLLGFATLSSLPPSGTVRKGVSPCGDILNRASRQRMSVALMRKSQWTQSFLTPPPSTTALWATGDVA